MATDFKADFFLVGATRCGTTTLHEVLAAHPDLCLPRAKETKFFYHNHQYNKGIDAYQRYYKHRRAGQKCGEVCPIYFDKSVVRGDGENVWQAEDDCAARIAKAYPRAKIILSLRDPIARAHSIFWKHKWRGCERAAHFEDAIEVELSGQRLPEEGALCHVWRNRYGVHLERWLEFFPRENIHIMIFEEWIKNPQVAMSVLHEALGLNDDKPLNADLFIPRNQGRTLRLPWLKPLAALGGKLPFMRSVTRRFLTQSGYAPMSLEIYQRLRSEFMADKLYVEDLLGRSISSWLRPDISNLKYVNE